MTTSSDIATAASKRLVIIESPCAATSAGTMQDHMDYLADALQHSLSRNEAPIASHGLFAFSDVLDETDEYDREQGIMAGLAWYRAADLIVFYVDYGISSGMARAGALAAAMGKTVEWRRLHNEGWRDLTATSAVN